MSGELTCSNVSEYGQNIPKDDRNIYFDFKCSACGAEVSADEMGNSPLEANGDHTPLRYCPFCGAVIIKGVPR